MRRIDCVVRVVSCASEACVTYTTDGMKFSGLKARRKFMKIFLDKILDDVFLRPSCYM